MKRIVLFDFHNTLATCDAWLDLEIRSLPGKVLERVAGASAGEPVSADLRDRAALLFRALRSRVQESGREISAAEGVAQVFREMGLQVTMAEIELAVSELEEELLTEVVAIDGVHVAVEQLRDAGYRLGVVSSAGYPPFVERSLEILGLREFFVAVLTSAGCGLYKSNPEIYRQAVRILGGVPSDAVHVGDHPVYDVQVAKSVGLSAVWFAAEAHRTAAIRGEPWSEPQLLGAGADAVVTGMAELFAVIERL